LALGMAVRPRELAGQPVTCGSRLTGRMASIRITSTPPGEAPPAILFAPECCERLK
jgi:hypothetical protein